MPYKKRVPRALLHATYAAVLLATCAPASVMADNTLDQARQKGKITIGVLANGGQFGSIDPSTQQLVGWNPELARTLAKALGLDVELIQVQTPTRVQFLISGKVDLLIASMEYTDERAAILGYAPTPFYRVGGTAATAKNSGVNRWEDLKGQAVCLSQGSNYAKPLAEKYGAIVKGYKTSSESLLALRGGNCIAAVHDAILIHPLLRTHSEWADFHAPIQSELIPASSVVWTRKGEADTIAAVDTVIQDWHRTGWLISTEKKLEIVPEQPLLQELHLQYKAPV